MTFRLEKDLQEKVKEEILLRYNSGVWYYHSRSMLQKDSIDIILCFYGRFIAGELKRDLKEKGPTKRQSYTLYKIAKAGGVTFVADTVEDVIKLLDNYIPICVPKPRS